MSRSDRKRNDRTANGGDGRRERLVVNGFTLVELVIVVAIVGILAAAVLPLAHWSVKRQHEYELQRNLRVLRNAIDQYHDLALAGMIEVDSSDTGYPPDLDTLVEGVAVIGDLGSLVPGVSDEYTASGAGLTGGYSGAIGRQQQEGEPPAGFGGGGRSGQRGGRATAGDDPFALQRGGGQGLGQDTFNSQRGGRRGGLDRDRRTRGGRTGSTDVQKLVFLRRLPVDPMTGETDWGLRCYGDSVDDRSWCGRNVFDVYSKAGARGIDGRPYREW